MTPQDWFDSDWALAQSGTKRTDAIRVNRAFVMAEHCLTSPLTQTRQQLLQGDDAFIARHHRAVLSASLREMSKAHRRAVAVPLEDDWSRYLHANAAVVSVGMLDLTPLLLTLLLIATSTITQ